MKLTAARREWSRRVRMLVAAMMVTGVVAVMQGCAAQSTGEFTAGASDEDSFGENTGADSDGNNSQDRGGNDGANNSSDDEPFVPEQEERFDFQAPRSSRNYVFVANSSLDTVAKIDADSLEIVSIEVGDRPTLVQTNRAENLAVVLNEGSDEVTVIRAGDGDDDYVRNLAITPAMNAIALAPRGDFALTWFDFDRAEADPDFNLDQIAPPLQDVSLIKLEEGGEAVYNLTVGFQVIDVLFDDEGQRAFIVTRTGISVVTLDEIDDDQAVPPVPVVEEQLEDDIEREVAITGDGRFAFIRTAGLEGLNILDLQSRDLSLVALSDVPTDLDIVPGQNRALAVLRRANELALIDLPVALEDPEAIALIALGDEPAGLAELTPDARKALVFTSVEERPAITVVDLDAANAETFALRKGVRAVAIDPAGDNAIIFHTKLPGAPVPGENEDDFIAKSFAYSLFDINTGYAKIETIPTEAGDFVFSEDANRLYVLLNDPAQDVRQVEIIDLRSFRTESLRLGSPPENVGFIPNEGNPRIYISQEHPVGRMTFINERDDEIKTVTGFELNSLID